MRDPAPEELPRRPTHRHAQHHVAGPVVVLAHKGDVEAFVQLLRWDAVAGGVRHCAMMVIPTSTPRTEGIDGKVAVLGSNGTIFPGQHAHAHQPAYPPFHFPDTPWGTFGPCHELRLQPFLK